MRDRRPTTTHGERNPGRKRHHIGCRLIEAPAAAASVIADATNPRTSADGQVGLVERPQLRSGWGRLTGLRMSAGSRIGGGHRGAHPVPVPGPARLDVDGLQRFAASALDAGSTAATMSDGRSAYAAIH